MISAIIPVYNGETYIAEAVASMLEQTLPPDEVLVVDDGSTDRTAEVVRRLPGVQYHYQENRGAGTARNLGIRQSKGDLIAFLDADDIWLPEKLRLQTAALEEDPLLDIVFCNMAQFRSPELSPQAAEFLVCDETPQPSPLSSCMLARRTAFERTGPLREDLKAEFVDWYLRAQDGGLKIRTLDELLVKRRIHGRNFSLQNKDIRHEYLRSLKASLDRRRAKASGTVQP
jgi:glycosyltransferase involved in cell wall biosynthesis